MFMLAREHAIKFIEMRVIPEDHRDLAACGLGRPFVRYKVMDDVSCSTSSLCLYSSDSLQKHFCLYNLLLLVC